MNDVATPTQTETQIVAIAVLVYRLDKLPDEQERRLITL
jgi:hypothetical protein